MNDPREKYLETAIDELYHGGPQPDLAERILNADQPPALSLVPAEAPRSRKPRRLWLKAACAVLALGVIGVALWPRGDKQSRAIVDNQPNSARAHESPAQPKEKHGAEEDRKDASKEEGRPAGDKPSAEDEAAEKELRRLREDAKALENKLGQTDAEIKRWADKGYEKKAADLKAEREELQRKLDDLHGRIGRCELELEVQRVERRIEEENGEIEAAKTGLKERPDNVELKASLDQHVRERDDLEAHLEDVRRELRGEANPRPRTVDELQGLLDRLRNELDELNAHPDRNADAIREHERSIVALEEAVARLHKADDEFHPDPDMPIDLDFVRKDLYAVMHYIALRSGLQIVLEDGLDVKVTVQFHHVKPIEAVRAICKANNLVCVEDGGLLAVKPGRSDVRGHVARAGDDPLRFNVTFEGEKLNAALMEIAQAGGLSLFIELPDRKNPEIAVKLNSVSADAALRRVCESAGVRLLVRGDEYFVRPAFAEMMAGDLEQEIDRTSGDCEGLEARIKELKEAKQRAIDAAGDDREAVARVSREHDAEINAVNVRLEAMRAEIKELKAELAGR